MAMSAVETGEPDVATLTDPGALAQAAFKRINARQFDEARSLVDRALALQPANPMIAHVRVHLDTDSGTFGEGAAYMRAFLAGQDPMQGINVHNAWHLAQIELELGRPGAALHWHARVIGPAAPKAPMTFFSAATLLWRLELFGYGDALRERGRDLPWAPIREAVGTAEREPVPDCARALVHLATGDEAAFAALLERLQAADGPNAAQNREVVVPLILGARSFWEGDYAGAAELLASVPLERLSQFPEHRGVFEELLAESQLRLGHYEDAEAGIRRRLDVVDLPRMRYWLGRAQLGLGQDADALTTLRAARKAWRHAEPDSPEVLTLENLLASATP